MGKDDNNTKIKEALKSLNNTHFKLIKQWMTENPDFKDVEQKQDYFVIQKIQKYYSLL